MNEGQRIKFFLKSKKITQNAVASALKTRRETINGWLKLNEPPIEFVRFVEKEYGYSSAIGIDQLSGDDTKERTLSSDYYHKYVSFLEEVANERKQKNASIEDRLDRIEVQNREIIELIKVNSETGNKVAGSLSWNQKVLVKILGHVLAAAEGKDLKEAEKKLNTILLEAHS